MLTKDKTTIFYVANVVLQFKLCFVYCHLCWTY